jgi:ketosteroid isomerase-like protein
MNMIVTGLLGALFPCMAAGDLQPQETATQASINHVLDDWHQAAAVADAERYFKYFTADAVFMGTDATERWTRDEFYRYAKPYFDKGKAWSFKPVKRNITVGPDGKVAWFDEELDTPNLGPARGSGVLVRRGDDWKIAQYNLSVPIPNEIFKEIKERIGQALKAKK